jgi:cell division septum initiation protein DivIVA
MDSTQLTGRTFTRTRRRDGYEVDEVDGFVTDVAAELDQRDKALGELRGELTAMRMRTQEPRAERPDSRQESSVAAARLLEIAAANADRLAAESSAEAESLVAAARAEAESLRSAAQAEADALLSGARVDAERLTSELDRRKEQQAAELEHHRTRVMAELSDKKAALEGQIAQLRQLEADHREHLRRHLTEQLAQLDQATAPSLRAVAVD